MEGKYAFDSKGVLTQRIEQPQNEGVIEWNKNSPAAAMIFYHMIDTDDDNMWISYALSGEKARCPGCKKNLGEELFLLDCSNDGCNPYDSMNHATNLVAHYQQYNNLFSKNVGSCVPFPMFVVLDYVDLGDIYSVYANVTSRDVMIGEMTNGSIPLCL